MGNPFEGHMSFYHIEEKLPPATETLKVCRWDIDRYNAPYLAGKASKPSYKLVELATSQAGTAPIAELPQACSEADKLIVVGNISHGLRAGSDVIVARTSNFERAGWLAEKMDYRPVFAGEFLQLLWWLRSRGKQYGGWFFCYAGRRPQYAILAEYNGRQRPSSLRVIFDTHVGNQVKEGNIDADADTHCLFVRWR